MATGDRGGAGPVSVNRDIVFWVVVVVVGGALVFASIPGGEERGRAPDRSSLEVSEGGYAGWALLLDDRGIDAGRIEQPPSVASLDPDETIVGLDLGVLTSADEEALGEFVAGGGRLVTGGRTSVDSLEAITGTSLEREDAGGSGAGEALAPAAELSGVTEIAGTGAARFTDAGEALPLYGDADAALLVEADRGEGEVLVLADSNPLTNAALASADNAQLAINLVGGPARGEVRFLERLAVGGEDAATGLAALPSNWIYGFAGLVLAAVVLVLSRLRRLGPPTRPPSASAQPRIGYVDAMARTLARSSEAVAAAEPVREAAVARIVGAGQPPVGGASASEGPDPDMLAAEAERAGISAEDARALAAPLRTPTDAVKATRALGRVWRERT